MRIITAGARYIDIDAYGGCIAYAELLRLQGIPAKAASSAPINASAPPMLRTLDAAFDSGYTPSAGDTFTLVDVSDPEALDPMVDLDRIDEVIDHHVGHEQYWLDRGQRGVDLEFVGAACTMIFERWAAAGLEQQMDPVTAQLLACGILDNTLNFGADISTERDKRAYDQLAIIAKLPADWPSQYFNACQETIESDFATAIRDDSKILSLAGHPGKVGIGQIVIWDAQKIIAEGVPSITAVMPTIHTPWYMSIVSISEAKNYLICFDHELQTYLSKLLHVRFTDNLAHTDRLWLRKEIIKQAIEKEGTA